MFLPSNNFSPEKITKFFLVHNKQVRGSKSEHLEYTHKLNAQKRGEVLGEDRKKWWEAMQRQRTLVSERWIHDLTRKPKGC